MSIIKRRRRASARAGIPFEQRRRRFSRHFVVCTTNQPTTQPTKQFFCLFCTVACSSWPCFFVVGWWCQWYGTLNTLSRKDSKPHKKNHQKAKGQENTRKTGELCCGKGGHKVRHQHSLSDNIIQKNKKKNINNNNNTTKSASEAAASYNILVNSVIKRRTSRKIQWTSAAQCVFSSRILEDKFGWQSFPVSVSCPYSLMSFSFILWDSWFSFLSPRITRNMFYANLKTFKLNYWH